MDISATSWFSDLEMEDTVYMDKCDIMDSFDEELAAILEEDIQNTLSTENNPISSTLIQGSSSTTNFSASSFLDAPQVDGQRPTIQYMTSNYDSSTIHNMPNFDQNSSPPIILNFENSSFQENHHQVNDQVSEVLLFQGSVTNLDEANKSFPTLKKSSGRIRPPSHTYNHIMAERKRRELLSQRFIALSAIVPGLKKMDKTSVLGDTIKYLKQLKERVKILEEQASNQTMESVVLVKKSQLLAEDEGSSDENGGADYGKKLSLPEIEARTCGQSVLLRIHCEKRKGMLVGILDEVDKFNLAVTNTSVAPFGGLTLDITIIAEMEKEFSLTTKELVRSLRSALQRVIEEA